MQIRENLTYLKNLKEPKPYYEKLRKFTFKDWKKVISPMSLLLDL